MNRRIGAHFALIAADGMRMVNVRTGIWIDDDPLSCHQKGSIVGETCMMYSLTISWYYSSKWIEYKIVVMVFDTDCF